MDDRSYRNHLVYYAVYKRFIKTSVALALLSALAPPAGAQSVLSGEPIRIARAKGPIVVDGDLSDEGWRDATRVDKWYETNPGDNLEPKVRSLGYLTYDDRFFYAGFEFDDPDMKAIRAPFADRDNIGNGFNDYGGILIDPRNTDRRFNCRRLRDRFRHGFLLSDRIASEKPGHPN